MTRYFEDFSVGDRFELGRRSLTRDEIVAFAREWDPQVFHTGEREWAYGKDVIASGVQIIGVWMRLFVDTVLHDTAVVAGREVEHLRMLQPLLPDMEVTGSASVVRLDPGKLADRASVFFHGALHTTDGQLLFEATSETLVQRRPIQAVAGSAGDPLTLTLRVPESEAIEDALWALAEDAPVIVSSVIPGDADMAVVVETELPAEEAVAWLQAAVPGLEISAWSAGRLPDDSSPSSAA